MARSLLLQPLSTNPSRCSDKLLAQYRIASPDTSCLSIDHDVQAIRNFPGQSSKNLPEYSLYPVPNRSATDFSGYCYSQTVMIDPVFPAKQHKSFRMHSPARLVDRLVIRGAHNSNFPGEPLIRFLIHSPSASCAPWRVFASTPTGHPCSTSVPGSRVSFFSCCC